MSTDHTETHFHHWIWDSRAKMQVCTTCGARVPMGGWSPPGPFTNPVTIGDIIQQTDKGEKNE